MEFTLVIDGLTGPELGHDFQGLVGEVAALPEAHTAGFEGVGVRVGRPAHPKPDNDSPFRMYVQRGKLLGQHNGISQRQQHSPRPDGETATVVHQGAHGHHNVPGRDLVHQGLRHPHRVKLHLFGEMCKIGGRDYVLDAAVVETELRLCHRSSPGGGCAIILLPNYIRPAILTQLSCWNVLKPSLLHKRLPGPGSWT